ncbi:MAG TPA: Asp-tRNA(Asn)/Glu-tRNA(Gln) amidotransferase GatCAB subunit B, partial [Gammaproteobacteria bacterium]
IEKFVDDAIRANPDQVEQYRAGKEKVLGFFVGQVMKASQGKANPGQVNALLKKKLSDQ